MCPKCNVDISVFLVYLYENLYRMVPILLPIVYGNSVLPVRHFSRWQYQYRTVPVPVPVLVPYLWNWTRKARSCDAKDNLTSIQKFRKFVNMSDFSLQVGQQFELSNNVTSVYSPTDMKTGLLRNFYESR